MTSPSKLVMRGGARICEIWTLEPARFAGPVRDAAPFGADQVGSEGERGGGRAGGCRRAAVGSGCRGRFRIDHPDFRRGIRAA